MRHVIRLDTSLTGDPPDTARIFADSLAPGTLSGEREPGVRCHGCRGYTARYHNCSAEDADFPGTRETYLFLCPSCAQEVQRRGARQEA